MAHFMRVLTKTTQAPTLPVLVETLEQAGFAFTTFPDPDDERYTAPDWSKLHLAYDERSHSLMLDRSLRGQAEGELEEDVEEFLEQLQAVQTDDAVKKQITDLLNESQQIFACYIPDDILEDGWNLVEALMEQLLDATGGTLQVDGEGFFDAEGELLLEME
ncbi:MAG TPA: hypothetical protein VFV52_12925 [Bacilli bacterium]|nr:hypothetical protein [Bacilli bacterium]